MALGSNSYSYSTRVGPIGEVAQECFSNKYPYQGTDAHVSLAPENMRMINDIDWSNAIITPPDVCHPAPVWGRTEPPSYKSPRQHHQKIGHTFAVFFE